MINKILINRKEGQLKKMSVAVVLILLLTMLLVTAQNLTESQSDKEITDLCENVECEDSSTECPDSFVASCSNVCDSEIGECSQCEPDCTGHEVILPEDSSNETTLPEETNETNSTIPEENITIPINETNLEPLPSNETNQTTTLPEDTNETSNETIPDPIFPEPISEPEELTPEPELPEIDIQLSYPNKITRGEEIELRAIITNTGNQTKTNILAELQLPPGFEIISGNKITNCGNLDNGETCEFSISVKSSVSTPLGNNEIKIKGNYKNGI
ncbi:MAG: NEW3 domain-containing protein [Nanoarchaeota archaeon]